MLITKLEQIEQEVTVDVTCDRCGRSCIDRERFGGEDKPYMAEFATVSWSFGYFSGRDGDEGQAHVCARCFNELENWLKTRAARLLEPEKPVDPSR